ncbi:MAG TPA: queuosine precursor transporter [Bryobacteraceae bacterium]|nr:queuosine precursor transporter [Bryobacteraceae bacterium]
MASARAVINREAKQYRYLDLLINIFLVVLVVSNLIAPKFVAVGWFRFSAAQLLFPITYIFGDVFTEVYGYSASRRAIWTGFMGSIVMTAFGLFAIWLPPAPEFHNQQAFETIFGVVPRNVAGSLLAYWAGEFANSLTVAKMKLWTNGKHLWTRTVGSTVVGQLVDTSIVIFFIFWGQPLGVLVQLIISGYLFKVVYEVLATPLTYLVVNFLKRTEGVNYFDRDTNFNPFARA